MTRLSFFIVSFMLLASGCFRIPKPGTYGEAKGPYTPAVAIAPTTDENGVVTATVNPSSVETQILTASASSNIADASVAFPAGSLAVSTQISIEEGASLGTSSFFSEIGNNNLAATNAAASVVISSSEARDPTGTLMVSLPMPKSAGLMLADFSNLVVLYRTRIHASNQYRIGMIPANLLVIGKNQTTVSFETAAFGAFQAVFLNTAPAEKVEKESESAIVTKAEEAKETPQSTTPTTNNNPTTSTPGTDTPVATQDVTAPVPGSAITSSNVTDSSLRLNWNKATDNTTPQASLFYKVYKSSSANIATIATAEMASMITSGANLTYFDVGALSTGTTYYFAIIVQDQAGNKGFYNMVALATSADATAPVPGGGGAINSSSITQTSLTLTWSLASDNMDSPATLTYTVYKSMSPGLTSVAAIGSGTIVSGPTAGMNTANLSGLTPGTTYYFNILVEDSNGNKAVYTMRNDMTLVDSVPPNIPDANIVVNNIGVNQVALSWTPATDDFTTGPNLTYKVCYSTNNDLTTLPLTEMNCTAASAYVPGISQYLVSGLNAGALYHFNIIVQDEAGNKNVYQSDSAITSTLHVAFLSNPTGPSTKLKHADNSNGAWNLSPDLYTTSSSFSPGLAINPTNRKPHMCYRSTSTYYLHKDSGSWSAATLVIGGGTSEPCGLSVGTDGKARIFSRNDTIVDTFDNIGGGFTNITNFTGNTVDHAAKPYDPSFLYSCGTSYSGGRVTCWDIDGIVNDVSIGGNYGWVGMDIDYGGFIHVAYDRYNSSANDGLWYAHNNGGWAPQQVVAGALTLKMVKVAVDPNSPSAVHLAFIDTAGPGTLKYARKNGGTWDIETIASNIGIAENYRLGMVVDGTGVVHIVYQNRPSGPGKIEYRHGNFGMWSAPEMIYYNAGDTGTFGTGQKLMLQIAR